MTMVALKRKSTDGAPQSVNGQAAKKQKTSVAKSKNHRAWSKPDPPDSTSDDLIESDTTETTNDFEGLSDSEPSAVKTSVSNKEKHSKKESIQTGANGSANGVKHKPDALANCKHTIMAPKTSSDWQQRLRQKKPMPNKKLLQKNEKPQSQTQTPSIDPRRSGNASAENHMYRKKNAMSWSRSCTKSLQGG